MHAKTLLHCFAERRVNHSSPSYFSLLSSFFPLHPLQLNTDQPPIPTPNPNLLSPNYTAQLAVRKQRQASHVSQLSTLSVASSISGSCENKITACELGKDYLTTWKDDLLACPRGLLQPLSNSVRCTLIKQYNQVAGELYVPNRQRRAMEQNIQDESET